jgi:hypothetical protein
VTAEARAGDGELPRQVVGDLVRVHDEGREFLAGRGLTQTAMAKVGELEVDNVEPLGTQDLIQRLLQRWHGDPQPVEAAN